MAAFKCDFSRINSSKAALDRRVVSRKKIIQSCFGIEALDVSVAELLGSQPKAARGKPGLTPQLQLRFEQIRRLPRKEQEFVIRFIDTVSEKAQKA